MKKFFTLLAAGAAVLGASAQDLTVEPIEIKNPLFNLVNLETPDVKPSNKLGLNLDGNKSGWVCEEGGTEWSWVNASKGDIASNNFGPAAWAMRSVYANENSDLTQEVPVIGPGPGVYVLTARAMVYRNNNELEKRVINGFNPEGDLAPQYGVLYCTDQTFTDDYVYGAPGCAALGNYGFSMAHVCVPYYSADFMPYLNIGIRWGQGVNVAKNAIITCTDFTLEYLPETADMEEEEAMAAANAFLKARQAEADEAAKAIAADESYGDNIGMSTSLFIGDVSQKDMDERAAYLQAIRNGENPPSGVEDIIAAPVKEDNRYFNLQGIEVAEPTQPGLYIHNGKKTLVK